MAVLASKTISIKLKKVVAGVLKGEITRVTAPSEVEANKAFDIVAEARVWAEGRSMMAKVWFELWETDSAGRKLSIIGKSDIVTKLFTSTADTVTYTDRLAMPAKDVLYLLVELYGEEIPPSEWR